MLNIPVRERERTAREKRNLQHTQPCVDGGIAGERLDVPENQK